MTALSYYIIIISIIDASSSPSWVLRRPFSCEPLACAFPNQAKTKYKNKLLRLATNISSPPPPPHPPPPRPHICTRTYNAHTDLLAACWTLLETPGVGDREKVSLCVTECSRHPENPFRGSEERKLFHLGSAPRAVIGRK